MTHTSICDRAAELRMRDCRFSVELFLSGETLSERIALDDAALRRFPGVTHAHVASALRTVYEAARLYFSSQVHHDNASFIDMPYVPSNGEQQYIADVTQDVLQHDCAWPAPQQTLQKEENGSDGVFKISMLDVKAVYLQTNAGRFAIVDHLACLGSQRCPFADESDDSQQCHGVPYKSCTDVVLKNAAGETFAFGSLLIHLIGEHQFYESVGLRYRVDPQRVVEFFGLQTDMGEARHLVVEEVLVLRDPHTRYKNFLKMTSGVGGPVFC